MALVVELQVFKTQRMHVRSRSHGDSPGGCEKEGDDDDGEDREILPPVVLTLCVLAMKNALSPSFQHEKSRQVQLCGASWLLLLLFLVGAFPPSCCSAVTSVAGNL